MLLPLMLVAPTLVNACLLFSSGYFVAIVALVDGFLWADACQRCASVVSGLMLYHLYVCLVLDLASLARMSLFAGYV